MSLIPELNTLVQRRYHKNMVIEDSTKVTVTTTIKIGKRIWTGKGNTKKEARKEAAQSALDYLTSEECDL